MQCKNAEPLIGAWQDGELDVWTSWRVSQHVRHCPTCTAEAESLTGLAGTLRQAAPLGVRELELPAPRRNGITGPISALALVATAAAAFLVLGRAPSVPIPDSRTIVQRELPPHIVATPTPPETPNLPAERPNVSPIAAPEPVVRRFAALKQPGKRLHPIRVGRKPSFLPPLTRPEWEGSSIRYVATLSEEERQVEIISIESELPPIDELRRLVDEKSEFIFVHASLPPELREGSHIPNLDLP